MRLRPAFQRMLSFAALTLLSALTLQARAVPIHYAVDTGTSFGSGSFTLADTNHNAGDVVTLGDIVDFSWTIPTFGVFGLGDLDDFQIGAWSLSDGLLSATELLIEIQGVLQPFANCRVCIYTGDTAGNEIRINGTNTGFTEVDFTGDGRERFQIRESAVPEPSVLGLTALGLLIGWQTRRNANKG